MLIATLVRALPGLEGRTAKQVSNGMGWGVATRYKGCGIIVLSSFFIKTNVRYYSHCKVLNSVKMITENTQLHKVVPYITYVSEGNVTISSSDVVNKFFFHHCRH